jgi:Helix-turn-helix domain
VFEIGNSLREARMRRGLDFAQAELATKVRGKYLRALEEEQFDVLPAQTYVKGFLRTYAEYLGLDGQLYVDEYNSRFVGAGDDHEPRVARRSAARPQRRHRDRRSLEGHRQRRPGVAADNHSGDDAAPCACSTADADRPAWLDACRSPCGERFGQRRLRRHDLQGRHAAGAARAAPVAADRLA